MSQDLQSRLDQLAPLLVAGSPHAADLGFTLDAVSPGKAVVRAPYRDDLIGDPETGVMHGGVVTALLDHAAGTAAFAGLGGDKALATLDLRIDYMRPAKPGCDVIAEAHTVKVSGLIAFVSAIAHDGDRTDPVATAHAAFMVSRVSQEAADRVRADIEAGRAGPFTRTPGPGERGGAR
ncbi:PaaI family thioesterase [Alkalicaulis satelles]|uniref:PaaI family thioesterase n=1 Tax=Alkalicaulis satelles TaxID=2609175 RepID=A0A5M6ZM36_9PROT|nr:PaaI family thioesterase [Alkalicaulis satelles]KAA5803321.1 PaaI family thioesterase [Alkalicaulis satelles]